MSEATGTTLLFGTSGIDFDMVSIKLPAADGGDPIPATTLKNVDVETFVPRILKTVTETGFDGDMKIADYQAVQNAVNVNQQITIRIPIPGTVQKLQIVIWGWLRSFIPGDGKNGDRWTGTGKIHASNRNLAGAETKPAYSIV